MTENKLSSDALILLVQAIRERLKQRAEGLLLTCSRCGCRQEAPPINQPIASGMASAAWKCRECGGGMYALVTIGGDSPTADQDIAWLADQLTLGAASLQALQEENAALKREAEICAETFPHDPTHALAKRVIAAEEELRARAALPLDTKLSEAERTVKSLATMLGWINVPPRETLEAEIRAMKARIKELARPSGAAEKSMEEARSRSPQQDGFAATASRDELITELIQQTECALVAQTHLQRERTRADAAEVFLQQIRAVVADWREQYRLAMKAAEQFTGKREDMDYGRILMDCADDIEKVLPPTPPSSERPRTPLEDGHVKATGQDL